MKKRYFSIFLRIFLFLVPILASFSAFAGTICDIMQKKADTKLKTAFLVSDEEWQDAEQLIEAKRVTLTQKRTDYIHDSQISKSTLDRICSLLKQYGIEPTALDIKQSTKIQCAAVTCDNNDISILLISPLLETFSQNEFEFCIVHEIGHLINMHHFHVIFDTILFSSYMVSHIREKVKEYVKNNTIPYGQIKHAGDQQEIQDKAVAYYAALKTMENSNQEKIGELYQALEDKLVFILLLYSLTDEQRNAYCEWNKTHEYVADQWAVSHNPNLMMVKIFFDCRREWYNQAKKSNSEISRSWYPSFKESYCSFYENFIRQNKQLNLYYKMRDYVDSSMDRVAHFISSMKSTLIG